MPVCTHLRKEWPVTKRAEKAAWEETQANPATPSLPAPLLYDPLCPTSLQASENMLGSRHGHTAFPGRQHSSHRPGAGLQLASLQLPEGFQQTMGTQVGCLPAKKPQAPHQKEHYPKSQETPEQGPQPRLQFRVMSHFQTRVLLSWHSSGTSVLKALWWVLRDLWVETH